MEYKPSHSSLDSTLAAALHHSKHRKIIAILGSSASGKTALAHAMAREKDCEIFSLDSLSIYKEIDIASAKPTSLEQSQVRYHALNVLYPYEKSNAMLFYTLLCHTLATMPQDKPLLIVGGSSFFLKSIVQGLSPMPSLDEYEPWVESLGDLQAQYALLCEIDKEYSQNISPHDTYRIRKALMLFKATSQPPSQYFATHAPSPFPLPLHIFALDKPRDELRADILKRCEYMLAQGIIDETRKVLERYGAHAPALQAIGTKECVQFLQGRIESVQALKQELFFHTCQLAKRQRTFNRTQFPTISILHKQDLEAQLLQLL